jgi:hypothetical protein
MQINFDEQQKESLHVYQDKAQRLHPRYHHQTIALFCATSIEIGQPRIPGESVDHVGHQFAEHCHSLMKTVWSDVQETSSGAVGDHDRAHAAKDIANGHRARDAALPPAISCGGVADPTVHRPNSDHHLCHNSDSKWQKTANQASTRLAGQEMALL